MAVGRVENTIYTPHRVTPDRVIVPAPKPFDAPPGVVPFYRMLKSENLASPNLPIVRPPDRLETSSAADPKAQLNPKLGEVSPIEKDLVIERTIEITTQVQLPATGRLLDIYL